MPSAPLPAPQVSVIIPAYCSDVTLPRSLAAIAGQSQPPLEIIVVDSSPSLGAGASLEDVPVPVRYFHVAQRLYPHQARNFGAVYARGDLLLFTDPDIYPDDTWLATMLAAWQATRAVVFSALACYGARWLDVGAHFCKYHICLPGGAPHAIDYGWSGAMLVAREAFWAVGGFPDQQWAGDTILSAHLRRAGYPLWFAADAVARHDHEAITWRHLLRERYQRGREFGVLQAAGAITGSAWTMPQLLRRVAGNLLLPLRVLLTVARIARQAQAAGLLAAYLRTLPVIVAGRTAWSAGNAAGYWDELRRRLDEG